MHRILDLLEEKNTPQSVKAARRKEEEEVASLALTSPSWHNYRDKQRQFLRKRERDRRQRDHQVERLAHASMLTVQMRLLNSELADSRKRPKPVKSYDASHLVEEVDDENVRMYVRRLSIDMARTLVPTNDSTELRNKNLRKGRTSTQYLSVE